MNDRQFLFDCTAFEKKRYFLNEKLEFKLLTVLQKFFREIGTLKLIIMEIKIVYLQKLRDFLNFMSTTPVRQLRGFVATDKI